MHGREVACTPEAHARGAGTCRASTERASTADFLAPFTLPCRVQSFNALFGGSFSATFGEYGAAAGRFDRPTALAAGPESLFVVDSGNQRRGLQLASSVHEASCWPLQADN